MGGFMQPQGHFQVLVNLLDLGMAPQQALDMPRWQLAVAQGVGLGAEEPGGLVLVEEHRDFATLTELARRRHQSSELNSVFSGLSQRRTYSMSVSGSVKYDSSPVCKCWMYPRKAGSPFSNSRGSTQKRKRKEATRRSV